MEKVARLVNILQLLKAHGSLTAQQLAEKLQVTPRTIYRDIEAMTLWRVVPIIAEPGHGGGYSLPEDYTVDPEMFTSYEVSVLSTGSAAIQGFADFIENPVELEQARAKLLSVLSEDERLVVGRQLRYIHFDRSRWYRDYAYMDTLKALKEAVVNNRQIVVEFRERDESEQTPYHASLVDAYGLVYKSDTWYLVGLAHTQQVLRRWNVTRISKAQITNGEFERPASFSLEHWWAEELEAFGRGETRILVRIDKSAWPRFSRFHWKKDNNLVDQGTHFEVEMIVDKYEWLIDLVMVNRGEVEILEPAEVRSRVNRVAEAIVRRHAGKAQESSSDQNIVDFEIFSVTPHDGD
jgi:predicted DNA-binding transcriptional regulator YafY